MPDLEHPNVLGTYVATQVVYATVLRENPADLKYLPPGVTPEAGAILRRIAWETVEAYSR